MTSFSYTATPDYSGSEKSIIISYKDAVVGSVGNIIDLSHEFHTVKNVTLTTIASGTLTESPAVALNGAVLTLYAVQPTGFITVEGY